MKPSYSDPVSRTSLFCRQSARALTLAVPLLLLAACGGNNGTPTPTPTPELPTPPTPENPAPNGNQRILINEAAATNREFTDDDGDMPDWFELHNPGTEPVSLAGWTVSDKPDKPDKWSLPDITLQSQETLLIWASNKDRSDATAPLHTNFALSADGETLVLHDNNGSLVHALTVPGTSMGITVGTSAVDGSPIYFDAPTPGQPNSAVEYTGLVEQPVGFTHQGGTATVDSVGITHSDANVQIRYTLDATIPDAGSPVYSGPISVTGNTVLRARAFRDNFIPSPTESRTYLVDRSHDIAVVTLVSDPVNLFDVETGIYEYGLDYERQAPHYGANFWDDREVDVHFSFFEESGELGAAMNAGVRIFGGWSRSADQRSLAIMTRSSYGTAGIDHPLFPARDYDTFKSVVLRNSGNDWMYTMMRDAAMTSLMEGSGLETQAFRPVATYINGEYWGMYNLREKINEHFLASQQDVDADDIVLLEGNAQIKQGDNQEWLSLVDFVENNDLAIQDNFQYVADRVDIDNLIIYQISQIFFNNTDWPGNNIRYWKTAETKWRWILYDTDFGFGLYNDRDYLNNTLSYALAASSGPGVTSNPPWSTLLIRRLMENSEFRNQFITRFADELNSRFLPANVVAHIDQTAATIASEMPSHFERWTQPSDDPRNQPRDWTTEVQRMKTFAELRPDSVMQHITSQFGLAGFHSLTIENANPAGGSVQVNSLQITDAQWQGLYFEGVPVQVTAIPNDGWQFDGWVGSDSMAASLEIIQVEAQTLQPVFSPIQ